MQHQKRSSPLQNATAAQPQDKPKSDTAQLVLGKRVASERSPASSQKNASQTQKCSKRKSDDPIIPSQTSLIDGEIENLEQPVGLNERPRSHQGTGAKGVTLEAQAQMGLDDCDKSSDGEGELLDNEDDSEKRRERR